MTSTRSNLGPLTTAFTYPTTCRNIVQQCTGCGLGWQGQTCSDNGFNTLGVQDNTECWPERDDRGQSISAGEAVGGWGFYSPGLSCPVGYATSCMATATAEGGFQFQFALTGKEMAVGCCPTGYHCKYNPGIDNAQTCYSIVTDDAIPTVQCSAGESHGLGALEIPAVYTQTVSGETTTSTLTAMTVYAPLFQLNFQSTDLPSSETGFMSIAGASSTPSASPASSSSSSSSSNGSGLSRGAKAGIGAAVGVVCLVLVSAVIFLLLRRRHKAPPPATAQPKGELPGNSVYPSELQGSTRNELA